jgi:hypothetical protein
MRNTHWNALLKKLALPGLRWVLALVLVLESAHFAISPAAAQEFAGTGFPQWIPPALGGIEAVAALLFLTPAAAVVGGYALLVIFAVAIAVHFVLGQYDVGNLVVYGMAVIVCMTRRKNDAAGAAA